MFYDLTVLLRERAKELSTSVTKLGDFLKFWVKYFFSKVAPTMYCDFWAVLKNVLFQIKTALATFGKIWATFNFWIWPHCNVITFKWSRKTFIKLLPYKKIEIWPKKVWKFSTKFVLQKFWSQGRACELHYNSKNLKSLPECGQKKFKCLTRAV